MDELIEELGIEQQLVSDTLAGLKEVVLSRSSLSAIERAAIATFILNVYNGMENMLKRVFSSITVFLWLIPKHGIRTCWWHLTKEESSRGNFWKRLTNTVLFATSLHTATASYSMSASYFLLLRASI